MRARPRVPSRLSAAWLGMAALFFILHSARAVTEAGPPTIAPLASAIVAVGQDTNLVAAVTGSPPLVTRWSHNGIPIPGAGTTTLKLHAVTLASAGIYTVSVSNHYSTVSRSAQLAVVNTASRNLFAEPGGRISLEAPAAGHGLTYQWLLSDSPLSNTIKYSGTTTRTLLIRGARAVDAGYYSCTINCPGAGSLATGYVNLQIPVKPPLPPTVDFPDVVIHNVYSYQIGFNASEEDQAPARFTCAGLPPGLVCNSATGVVSGKPTRTGTYGVIVTLSNRLGASPPVRGTITVQPFPTERAGTYQAVLYPSAGSAIGDVGGRMDLVISPTGAYSGSLTLGIERQRFAGLIETYPADATSLAFPHFIQILPHPGSAPLVLNVSISPETDSVVAFLSLQNSDALDVTLFGWHNTWRTTMPAHPVTDQLGSSVAYLQSYGGASTPGGYGYGTLSVAADGTTAFTGHTSDGEALAFSGILGPAGESLLFIPLYSGKGSLVGSLSFSMDGSHDLSGTMSWCKLADTSPRGYPGFGPVPVTAVGGRYVAAAPMPGPDAALTFTDGGLSGSAMNPDIRVHVDGSDHATVVGPNPAGTTLALNSSTGNFTGLFTLVDGTVRRTAIYQGQFVPSLGQGYGYFLLPQLGAAGTSAILSGSVVLSSKK